METNNTKTNILSTYQIALITIVLIFSIGAAVLSNLIIRHAGDSHLINIAGRQRMLNQKISKYLILSKTVDNKELADEYKTICKESFKLFFNVHQNLTKQEHNLELKSYKILPENKLLLDSLSDNINFIKKQIESSEKLNYQLVVQNDDSFLLRMNKVLKNLETDSDHKITKLLTILWSLTFILVLIVVLFVKYLFQPIVIRNQYIMNELEQSNLKMNEVIEELQATEEELRESVNEYIIQEEELKRLNNYNEHLVEEIETKNNHLLKINQDFENTQEELRQNLEELNTQQEQVIKQNIYINSINNALDFSSIVSITDYYGSILRVNDKFCEISQYSKDELVGANHNIVNSGFYPKEFWKEMWDTVKSGKSWRNEVLNKAKDGTFYWVDTVINPIFNINGEIIEFFAIRNLITEKKENEIELIKTKNLLEQSSKAARIGAWEVDLVQGIVTWSDITREIHEEPAGFAPTIEGSVYYFKEGENRDKIIASYTTCIENAQPFDLEFEIITRNGNAKWVNSIANPVVENGQVVKIFGITQDIDKRKRTEEALSKNIRNLDLVVEYANIGIWNWNPESNEVWFSESWKKLIGYSEDEISNNFEEWATRVHPDDLDKVYADIAKHVNNEVDVFRNEHRMKHKKGHWVWILDQGSIIERNKEGKPTLFVGTHLDISKVKEAEENLKISTQQADAANKAKSQFLANMSHEIRTPLNGILGFTDILSQTNLSNEQQQHVQTVHSSAQLLLRIINDILDFSKIEAGKLDLELVPTNLSLLCKQVVDILKPAALAKNLVFDLDLQNVGNETVNADGVRLKQILANLLSNAIKFTLEGRVTLSVSKTFEENNSATYKIEIKDTGIGISDEQAAKLFKAFSQADVSTSRKFGGTGLGLVISNMLAMKMGSQIEFKSEVGQGSLFYFEVKFEKIEGEVMDSFAPKIDLEVFDNQTINSKILVAEDVPVNMKLIKIVLTKMFPNVQLLEAVNGQMAVEMYQNHHPDLIFMDLQMSILDGYGATSEIRSMDLQIPIVALTADAIEGEREKCLNAGMNEYLTKPLDKEKIKQTVIALLGQK